MSQPTPDTAPTIQHDTLFTTPLDKAARFSFDEQVVACFPDMIRRSVPGYGQVLAMLPLFARRHCKYRQQKGSGQRVSRIYDLGCSLGVVVGSWVAKKTSRMTSNGTVVSSNSTLITST